MIENGYAPFFILNNRINRPKTTIKTPSQTYTPTRCLTGEVWAGTRRVRARTVKARVPSVY
jgi:hypothetical protein